MFILVEIRFLTTEEGGRTIHIGSGYRPDWASSGKPELNCAQLFLPEDVVWLELGEKTEAIISPLRPELWKGRVKVGDVVSAFEGNRLVADATVIRIFDLNPQSDMLEVP